MRTRSLVRTIVLALPVFFLSFMLKAQPILPGIAGVAENGIVLLSWECQYDGVKAIAVRRSADSAFNYKIIGYVKNTAKGTQAFADGHPQPGNNYYKLNIVFNSGLNWSSNHCMVFVDSVQLSSRRAPVPSNDSLQRYVKMEAVPVSRITLSGRDLTPNRDTMQPKQATIENSSLPVFVPADTSHRADTIAAAPQPVRKKITLSFPGPDIEEATFIRSQYITTNKLTGHVEIRLPTEARGHVFSIKFYNKQGKLQVDIPEIKTPFVILDKRNFQRKGLYKFVLKKDDVMIEEGYVDVVL